MQYRNLDPLDVSMWGRQAAFERAVMKALRAIPQDGDVTLSTHVHDSIVIDAGELTSEDLRSLDEMRANSWWNRPNPLLGVCGLLVGALLLTALVTCSSLPADPLTIAGDQDD